MSDDGKALGYLLLLGEDGSIKEVVFVKVDESTGDFSVEGHQDLTPEQSGTLDGAMDSILDECIGEFEIELPEGAHLVEPVGGDN